MNFYKTLNASRGHIYVWVPKKIKAQGQSEGHMTSAFMLYILKKKHNKKYDIATLIAWIGI